MMVIWKRVNVFKLLVICSARETKERKIHEDIEDD